MRRAMKKGMLPKENIFLRLSESVFASVLMLWTLSGCASGLLHEGAYVGNGSGYDPQRPSAVPSSSVPLFASREVKDDARNRVAMERATGRPVMARPVTVSDVLGWHQSGVRDENIMTHIRTHGLYQPLQGQDILTLQNHGVSVEVIRSMKEHPYPKVDAPVPPPESRGNSFTRFSTNPDTNPGNGVHQSGNSGPYVSQSASPRVPTAAPPVVSTGERKTRIQGQIVPYSPSCGSCAGEMAVEGAALVDGIEVPLDGGVIYCEGM